MTDKDRIAKMGVPSAVEGTTSESRRDLLRLIASSGVIAATSGGLLTVTGDAVAQTPKKGGRIRVASLSSSAADTLDPAKGALSTDYSRAYMFYNGLTQFDASLFPHPSLAEEIRHSKATVWNFKLRKDVRFHDGKPLTAADVVYSLTRHKNPATASKAKALADQFQEIKAVTASEVQITLAAPNADLPVILASSHFLIIKDGTTDFATAIGTGPYKCKAFQPGIRTVGVRNENYWKAGKPYVDEIELIGISDEPARVNALLSGDVHLINAVNPRSTSRIKAKAGFAVIETKSGLYTDLIIRQDKAPYNAPDFALAMKYMMDRTQIRDALFRGYAVLGNDQPIPPSHRYFNADLPQRPFDPEKAKFHLQKSGLAGATVPLVASAAAEGSVDIAVLMQQTAQKVGLKLTVNRVPGDGYWSNHWMKHPLGFGNINPRPSADVIFTQFFKSDAAWNESGWKNEQFDQLLLLARAEADEAKRKKLYGDMQVIIHEKCGIGIPVFMSFIDAHSTKLKGVTGIPAGGLMGYMFAEHVWLDG